MEIRSLRRASVGAKLAILSCAIVALIFAAFTWAVTRSAGTQVSEQALARIHDEDRALAQTIALYDEGLGAEVTRFMSLFASFLPAAYTLDDTRKVDVDGLATPTLKGGDQTLNLDFTVPDQFLERSGAISTVFA